MSSNRPTFFASVILIGACGGNTVAPDAGPAVREPPLTEEPVRVDSRPPPMAKPIPLWEDGKVVREVDAATADLHGYVVVDLGEEWTPYLFTEKSNGSDVAVEHGYREDFLALARGEFPDNHHGARARQDKYLELYGIPPTLGLVRSRLAKIDAETCAAGLDLASIAAFTGTMSYKGNDVARQTATQFETLERAIEKLAREHRVPGAPVLEGRASAKAFADTVDVSTLDVAAKDRVRLYKQRYPAAHALAAIQARLDCEGFYKGKPRYIRGGLDWSTRDAIAEFERKQRIYGWGVIARETLAALAEPPAAGERDAVLRVLTERALLAVGGIEDGSINKSSDLGSSTYRGRDGKDHPIPNVQDEVEETVIKAFGLQTVESTRQWLNALGELPKDAERLVAIPSPSLPDYYGPDMNLSVEIDRGDVWYDFPYDEQGVEQAQPVSRRPTQTIYTTWEGQKIPLARFGTTIGGWRTEWIDNTEWWKYKESPAGPVVWSRIVAAPVWIPPDSSPPRGMLTRSAKGPLPFTVNLHEMGPSYASAYGLVAAYHVRVGQNADGTYDFLGDEGIRTHGSVDYMSIMRRHSHGCHRLHNHIAIRLMSFVLAHRPHDRRGEEKIDVWRNWEYQGHAYSAHLTQGGYVFKLLRPIPVNVARGRVLGQRQEAYDFIIPKYNADAGAYLLPDGGAVALREGSLVSVPRADGGLVSDPLDAGVPAVEVPPAEATPLGNPARELIVPAQ